MPGSVHHSAVLLRKSSRLVATMAIHTADLIAVQERSLSSVMLENRSCSWSSYLGDGCWQPTQALCACSCFFLLALNLLFPLPHLSPIAVVFLLLASLTPPPVSTPASCCLYAPFLTTMCPFSSIMPVIYFYFSTFPSLSSIIIPPIYPAYFPSVLSILKPLPSSTRCLISLPFLTFNSNLIPFPLSTLLYHLSPTLPSTPHCHPFLSLSVSSSLAQASSQSRMQPPLPDLEKIADPTDAILSLSCILSLLFPSTESWQPQRATWNMHSSLTTRLSLSDCDFEISIINCIVRGQAISDRNSRFLSICRC